MNVLKAKVLAALVSVLAGAAISPAYCEVLQGGVNHADYLPSLRNSPYAYADSPVGALQGQAGRQVQRMVEWFKIPPWMAGTWSKQGDMTINAVDLRTGQGRTINQWTDNRMTVAFGHQIDRSGTIWQANILPSETDSISGGKSVRFLAVQRKCESYSPTGLITRTHYIITESYGNQVAEEFQQESLNHYSALATGELLNRSSNRVFSYQGQATQDGNLESRFHKIADFRPVATLDGVDLNATFASFLQAIGRPDLIPGAPPVSSQSAQQ